MAEHSTAPENGQETQTEETQNRKRPGKKPLIILGVVVIVMVVVALVWWLLTRNEEMRLPTAMRSPLRRKWRVTSLNCG